VAGVGQQAAVFGKRREPHTIIIARGEEIKHFTIRPWLAAVVGTAVALASVGYLLATSYLVFRDDLIGASVARQARLQQDYEDRISALRVQVDRITSRQMLDQKIVESKLTELMARQGQLSGLSGRVDPDAPSPKLPAPDGKPDLRAAILPAPVASSALLRGEPVSAADKADKAFVTLNASLADVESEQLARIDAMTQTTYQAVETISEGLQAAGLDTATQGGIGGPYVPLTALAPFDAKAEELDGALDRLEALKDEARRLPLANPAAGRQVSSTFGVRTDPILGTPAMHSGIDFKAPVGSPADAAAAGIVVKAGWNGGYGQMVEIDHGNGFTTRYAHLSRILVAEGDKVSAGQPVGEVGSTGRSTGAHLHYEVREGGEAVDPLRFLNAGKRVAGLL
jgi:murein DD-endopeptidase MepM/ murein hydrolase activator NlpD